VRFTSAARVRHGGVILSACKCQSVMVDCKQGITLELKSYSGSGSGRMDILAQAVDITPSVCKAGRILTSLPKLDVVALNQAVACANILRMRSENGYNLVAEKILNYIQAVTQVPSLFSSATEATSLMATASQYRQDMIAQKQVNRRPLPTLSNTAYTFIFKQYAQIFDTYDQKYTKAFDSSVSNTLRVNEIGSMVTKVDMDVALQKKKTTIAANAVEESKLTMAKLKAEYKKSSDTLEAAKKKLQAGIEEYKRKQIAKSVFGFFRAIGSLFKSIATIVVGALTGNVAMVVGGVGDLISDIADIVELIMDTIEMVETIQDMINTSNQVGDAIKNLEAPENSGAMLDSIDDAAEMRVKAAVWQTTQNMADIKLGSGTITEISGCSDFRKALSETAVFGEGLSHAALAHAEYMRRYIIEALRFKLLKKHAVLLKALHASAKSQNSVSTQLLEAVSAQVSSVQVAATRTMTDYCYTSFYSNFVPCSDEYVFSLADRLHMLQVKTHRMAVDQLYSTRAFALNPPHPFVQGIILKDETATNCSRAEDCPITQLKANRRIQFNIPIDSSSFSTHERVRILQLRVYLHGVQFKTPAKVYSVEIHNDGIIDDKFNGKTYSFHSIGRILTYTFNEETKTSNDHACVHTSVSDHLFQLTPWCRYWSLKILSPESIVNLEHLTSVELFFVGSSITNRQGSLNREQLLSNTHGQKDIAPECMSSSRAKRSVLFTK